MKRYTWLVLCALSLNLLVAQENNDKKENATQVTTKLAQLRESQNFQKSYRLLQELLALGDSALEAMLKMANDPTVSLEVKRLLTEGISQFKSEKALDFLKTAANAEDSWIRYHGISGLALLKKEQELVTAGLASPEAIVKESALRGLAHFEVTWEKTPNSVLEVLEAGHPQLISSALALLGKVKYSTTPDFLVSFNKLLKRDDLAFGAKIETLQTMARFPQEETINLFVNFFDKETYDQVGISQQERFWIQSTILSSFQEMADSSDTAKALLQKESVLGLLKKALAHEQALIRAKAYLLLFTLFSQEKELLKNGLKDSSPLVQAVCIQKLPAWGEQEAKPILISLTSTPLDPENQGNLVQSLTTLGMPEAEARQKLGQAQFDGKWYSKSKAEQLTRLQEEIQKAETLIVENKPPQVTFFTERGKFVFELFESSAKDAVWHFLNCVEKGYFDQYLIDDLNISYATLQLPSDLKMDYTVKGSVQLEPLEKGSLLMVADDDANFGGRRFRWYLESFEGFQNKTFTFIGKVVEGQNLLKELSIGDKIKAAKITRLPKAAKSAGQEVAYYQEFAKLSSEFFRQEGYKAYNEREDTLAERYWKKALELNSNDFKTHYLLCNYYYRNQDYKSAVEAFERFSQKLLQPQTFDTETQSDFKKIASFCTKMREKDEVTGSLRDRTLEVERRIQQFLGK